MQDLDWNRKDIDFLIFISQTTDYLTPATSIIIQNKLGLKKVFTHLISIWVAQVSLTESQILFH